MFRPALAVSAVFFASGTPALASSQQAPVVFTGVSVIPMDRETVLGNQTVIVENGRITYVGSPRSAPAGATTVDARGKFLMPAIAEFHAHVPSGQQAVHAHRTLSLYVLAGVTTARGMLGAPMHLALRDSIAAGQLLGPRLLTSGPSFNGNSATSPSVAATMVRDQKAAGYDLLKIHPGVPRAAFDSLAAVANALRIPFAGHVPLEVGLDLALTSKYSTIDHLDGIVEAMYAGPQPLTPQVNGFFGLGIMRQLDQSRFGAIVDRVKASGVAMVPTQILMDNFANDATGDELTSLPEFKYWVPQQVAAWRTNKNNYLAQAPVPREQRQEFIALRRRIIKALYDGGVPFLLGSDAPQLWNVPGFSAHRELGALVAAGLTPYQALRTGTVDVAKFMGEEGRAGVVRVGARADLLLLDANPLSSIANSLRINGVVVNGRWIGPAERERMLAALAQPSAPPDSQRPATAQPTPQQPRPYQVGNPLGLPITPAADDRFNPTSPNVKVFGSVYSAESCSYDADRRLIVVPNRGVPQNVRANDAWITLLNPDGSVHTARWIGVQSAGSQRDGMSPPLVLNEPFGSAIVNGVLYLADRDGDTAANDPVVSVVRRFDMKTGAPLADIRVPDASWFNDIAVNRDGTVYGTVTGAGQVWRVMPDGQASIFVQGAALNRPNGVALDRQGNVVVVNTGGDSVLTFSADGRLVRTERAAQAGSDGVVIMDDGTKYVSSVVNGGVSRIRPGQAAELIAENIPNAASMCFDSGTRQLVIPMNANNALAFLKIQ